MPVGVLYNTTDISDTYVFRSLTQTFDAGMGTAAGFLFDDAERIPTEYGKNR